MKIPMNTCQRVRLYVESISPSGNWGLNGAGFKKFHMLLDFVIINFQCFLSNVLKTFSFFLVCNCCLSIRNKFMDNDFLIKIIFDKITFHFLFRFCFFQRVVGVFVSGSGCFYSKALANIDIGCSHGFVVDISICHLQVSQSVATMSQSQFSICLNREAPISCDVL